MTDLIVLTLTADYCGSLIGFRTSTPPLNAVYARSAEVIPDDGDGNTIIAVTTTVGTIVHLNPDYLLDIRPAEINAIGQPV